MRAVRTRPPVSFITQELRALLTLAWPLIGSNLLVSLMNFIDVMMAGRLGGRDLAAVGIGSSVWLLCFLAMQGILTAVSPMIAQHCGAGRLDRAAAHILPGVRLALVAGVTVLVTLQLAARPLLTAIGIDPEVLTAAIDFINAISWGAPAIGVFLVFRFVLEGMGHTRPILYISAIALLFNVAGNVVFMYGHLGVAPMGAAGAGLASALSMWLTSLLAVSYFVVSKRMTPLRRLAGGAAGGATGHDIVKLGLPIAGTVIAEHGFFIAITLIMGTISVNAAAAHQIAMNYTSVMYMVPMALASAVSIRVGHAVGAGDLDAARRQGLIGAAVCAGFMTVSAAVLLVFHQTVARAYSADPGVAGLAALLLLVAAAFQVSDGIQVGLAGALRGMKDTRIPFLLSVASYWAVGFPLAWLAASTAAPRPERVWWGFVIGLSLAAALLLARFTVVTRRLRCESVPVQVLHKGRT